MLFNYGEMKLVTQTPKLPHSVGQSHPLTPKKRHGQLYKLTWLLPMGVWQIIFFVVPLFFLIALTFWTVKSFRITPDFDSINWIKVYSSSYFWDAYFRTFIYAGLAAILLSVLSFPAAYYLAFCLRPTVQRIAVLLLITPFFTSYLVRVFTWQAFLSDAGIINSLLAGLGLDPFSMLNTTFGIYIGYMTLCFPLVVLLQFMSLVNIDRSLVEAAHNLRCGPLKTVWSVVIPSARVGITLGAVFCFILTFGDFVSPTYLGGGNSPTLAILITDFTKAGNQWPRAAVVAVTMVVTLIIVAFMAVRFAYKTRRSENV